MTARVEARTVVGWSSGGENVVSFGGEGPGVGYLLFDVMAAGQDREKAAG